MNRDAETWSVSCAGQKVTDRPELLREWDYETNKLDPETTVAGTREKAAWICLVDPTHRWTATIVS